MRNPNRSPDLILEDFRGEVLRWNRRINLVSRRAPEARVQDLQAECLAALGPVLAALELDRDPPVWRVDYFDLGSGNGFPGFIWHIMMAHNGLPLKTHLVEPRANRAWFLRRLGKIEGVPPFAVLESRWGEVATAPSPAPAPPAEPAAGAGQGQVLISLKALRLSEEAILLGLEHALGPAALEPPARWSVAIARFVSAAASADSSYDRRRPESDSDAGPEGALDRWTFLGADHLPLQEPGGRAVVRLSRYLRS